MKTNESMRVQKGLVAALVLVLMCLTSCFKFNPAFNPADEYPTDRIERITKVRVPEYKVTKFAISPPAIDFTDTMNVEFESVPSDEVFETIDELMAANEKSGWHTDDSIHYSFNTYWGNGTPAPEGEDEEDDGTFELHLTKGEKAGVIIFGCW